MARFSKDAAGAIAAGALMLNAMVAVGAPAPTAITGEAVDGAQVTITGSQFGTKPQSSPFIFDQTHRVWINGILSNPYSGFNHGDEIPHGDGWPWARNPPAQANIGPIVFWDPGSEMPHYGCEFTSNNPHDCWIEYPAGFPDPGTKEVTSVYIRWWLKGTTEFTTSGGTNKLIRIWDTKGSDPVGIRISWTTALLGGVESRCREDGTTGGVTHWNDWQGKVGEWNLLEIYVDAPKGIVRAWTNGTMIHNITNFEAGTRSCLNGEIVSDGVYQGIQPRLWGVDGSGTGDWTGSRVELADYYADQTLARVEIGDAPSWSQVRIREVQMPLAWSDNRITAVLNKGRLDSLEGKYLYIVDKDGNVNAQGFPLEGSALPKPPADVTAQ